MKDDVNDLRFNFSPCFCRVGNQYVVSSTLELCRELIDMLVKEQKDGVARHGGKREFQVLRKRVGGGCEVVRGFAGHAGHSRSGDSVGRGQSADEGPHRAGEAISARWNFKRPSRQRNSTTTFARRRRSNAFSPLSPEYRGEGRKRPRSLKMTQSKPIDPAWAWQPYTPSDQTPWTLQQRPSLSAHDLRRNGGATRSRTRRGAAQDD